MARSVFSKNQLNFLFGISSAMGLKQLGLLLVMPLLAIYGKDLAGSTDLLVGLSLGIYGLAQACLQIPYGIWSDKIGRKPVLLMGLMQLILGLFLAFLAKNIYMLILARALQGSGAIMAVAYSWIGDKISDSKKHRAMGIVGMVMGTSAVLAFIGGPILHRFFSVPQMFLFCAMLTLLAWFYILLFLKGDRPSRPDNNEPVDFRKIVKNHNLLKVTVGGFILNYILVSVFFIVPQLLESELGSNGLWKVFVPATLISIVVMNFTARLADAGYFIRVTSFSFIVLMLSGISFYMENVLIIGLGMVLFMAGYITLVTLLPASVTKMADKSCRGSITGAFNTVQFLGSFTGGFLTGLLWGLKPSLAIFMIILLSVLGGHLLLNIKQLPISGRD